MALASAVVIRRRHVVVVERVDLSLMSVIVQAVCAACFDPFE
jgi:hypothetical protein